MTTADLELMHRVLDGEATPGDRLRLDSMLAADTAASRTFEELKSTWDLIGNIPMTDPPADLHRRIVESLPAERYRARANRPDIVSVLRTKWRGLAESFGSTRDIGARFASRPVLAAAYVFTVGLIAGAGLYSLVAHPTDPSLVTGTLAAKVVREVPVEVPGFRGTIRLRSSADALILDVSYDAQEPVELGFSFEAGLHLRSVVRAERAEGALSIGDRSIHMIAEGKSEYEFVFARNAAASSEIHIEVQRHGERLHAGELSAE